jgi:hypothetical protein
MDGRIRALILWVLRELQAQGLDGRRCILLGLFDNPCIRPNTRLSSSSNRNLR